MECPNYKGEISKTMIRSTNHQAAWYKITDTEMRCPKCDAKVIYTKKPNIIAATGCIIYGCTLLFNLSYPENDYKELIGYSGLFIFVVSIFYWQRNKKLLPAN